jgi:hypothetical protein
MRIPHPVRSVRKHVNRVSFYITIPSPHFTIRQVCDILLCMKSHAPSINPPIVMNFFFVLGILCACSFRVIIVFHHIDQAMVRPIWYFGTIGYIFFFYYRYGITKKRKKAVEEYGLVDKISENKELTREEREAAVYLLGSITKSHEGMNYFVIFILSMLAVVIDLVLTAGGS